MNKRIEVKEWREHFMTLLGGVEGSVEKRGERRLENGEQELGRSEVKNIVKKLKKGKAAEEDGVPNEVWKYVCGGKNGGMGVEFL